MHLVKPMLLHCLFVCVFGFVWLCHRDTTAPLTPSLTRQHRHTTGLRGISSPDP